MAARDVEDLRGLAYGPAATGCRLVIASLWSEPESGVDAGS